MTGAVNSPDLLAAAKSGDREASDTLVKANMGLVYGLVRRFAGRGADPEELTQIGLIGLLKAILAFDPSYGTMFSTYAVPKIEGELRRYLRDGGLVRVSRKIYERAGLVRRTRRELSLSMGREPLLSEIAAALKLSVEEIAEADLAFSGVDSLDREIGEDGDTLEAFLGETDDSLEENIAVRDAVSRLPYEQREVILLIFYRGLNQTQAGKCLGVSQVQVSRLQKKALAALKKMLE